MKNFTILAINPGSTSTKLALFENTTEILSLTLRHSAEELKRYVSVIDQLDFRKGIIVSALHDQGIDISTLDAVIGRGGLVKPIRSGVYEVNDRMIDDLKHRPMGHHASNLGALLADDIARMGQARAFIADPVVVDELQDVARISGLPEIQRVSIFHALNQKAVARNYAESCNRHYEEMNLIVAHLGGGISVGAHRNGVVVDVNNALDGEGPFSPERAGGLTALPLVRLCFSGKYSKEEITRMINGQGGMVAHLGTNNVQEIVKRASDGDERTKLILDAMCYNIAKEIGAMATVLEGRVDAILLTGGIAYNRYVCDYIEKMVSFIADVRVSPGENEMEALASNALRVLNGQLMPQDYR